jgi:hypothetical protein
MVDDIEQHKDEFGVEPICTTLQFPHSTYYAAKSRVPSARAMRDAVLLPLLLSLWIANYRVYGARKLWKAAQRAGEDLGFRDQVVRLMRQLGIQGVHRSKKIRTTRPDEHAAHHPDLVDRQSVADRPTEQTCRASGCTTYATPSRPSVKSGEPAKIVTERLGHSTAAYTQDAYQEVMPGMQRDAARRLGQRLQRPPSAHEDLAANDERDAP